MQRLLQLDRRPSRFPGGCRVREFLLERDAIKTFFFWGLGAKEVGLFARRIQRRAVDWAMVTRGSQSSCFAERQPRVRQARDV
ncbi:hypothetical protein HJFPF1_09622 [Paramyrothecium foliicola]|nr:hypothetical protein HJFPF1_09622 [Paramyrothecium foliicola]